MIPERFGPIIGTMQYRGVTITSHFERSREGGFFKWYFDGKIGTPCLAALLNGVDYVQAGMPEQTERLVALPVGDCVWTQGRRYLKTDCEHEHENPGNWFVDLLTGKMVHAGTIAAKLCEYKPRTIHRRQRNATTY